MDSLAAVRGAFSIRFQKCLEHKAFFLGFQALEDSEAQIFFHMVIQKNRFEKTEVFVKSFH